MNVSIIIPNWNGKELMEKNLPFVLKAKENKSNKILEIIIVDDGSTDDSYKFIKENYGERIKVIKHTKNRGFSSAVNTGVRSAKGDFICLLNTDVVPENNFLVSTKEFFNDKKVFGVSLHEKGYGGSVGKFRDGFIVHDPGRELEKPYETFWVSGGSGVFRRSTWMSLKGFDETLLSPLYWEDLDICYRALKRGYILLWDPKARVAHEHESTTSKLPKGKVNTIRERNQLLVNWKNLTSAAFFKKHLEELVKRCVAHPGYIRIVIIALFKFKDVMKLRKIEQRESVLSDEAVFAKFS
ncbi:MAG: glycosyltransferase family 2 protein [Patescibacteria group bacterium]